MNAETDQRLTQFFKEHPTLVGGPVTEVEVLDLEKWVGFRLPDSYKSFVLKFGGAIVGHLPISGLRRGDSMSRRSGSVIEKTDFFRKQKWPGTESWLVISSDQGGNPIGLDQDGKIWTSDHDCREILPAADNFDDFISKLLKNQ